MYKVKDYRFETEEEAREAKSELKAVDFLRTKIDMNEPEAALAIFKQLIDQDIFHTIVGYDFLKGLQNFLRSSAAIDNADIPQIPDSLARSVLPKMDTEVAAADNRAEPQAGEPVQAEKGTDKAKEEAAAEKGKKKKADPAKKPVKKGAGSKRKRKPKRERKPRISDEQDLGQYQRLAYIFMATTVILFLAIVAMFAITLTSGNPTIINYENEILDKYSEWEETLDAKEQELKQREADIEKKEQAWQRMERENGEGADPDSR